MKRIECGDLVPGCAFHAQAETESEVLAVEAAHARATHSVIVTSNFIERARQRIQNVNLGEAAAGTKAAEGRRGRG
jgi:predicted small metal-binding protein